MHKKVPPSLSTQTHSTRGAWGKGERLTLVAESALRNLGELDELRVKSHPGMNPSNKKRDEKKIHNCLTQGRVKETNLEENKMGKEMTPKKKTEEETLLLGENQMKAVIWAAACGRPPGKSPQLGP